MTTVYLIRHAKPQINNLFLKFMPPLKNNMKQKISHLGKILATEKLSNPEFSKIDVIYSSDYTRAYETSQILAKRLKLKVIKEKNFGERIHGVENSYDEIPKDFEEKQLADENYKLPLGESQKEVKERMLATLKRVINENKNKNIAIFTHATAMTFLLKEWCSIEYQKPYKFQDKIIYDGNLDYCETFKLEFDEENNLTNITNIATENKYSKVMFGLASGSNKNFSYSLDKINISKNWHPQKDDKGGFTFANSDQILKWIHRGDTIYNVIIPKDSEIVEDTSGILRSNKIILTNPRELTDDLILKMYKKSKIQDSDYPKVLGAISIRNYRKTAEILVRDKVNDQNIKFFLSDWNSFISEHPQSKTPETVTEIQDILHEINNQNFITQFIDRIPYEKQLTDDKIINLTGLTCSGKTTYINENLNNINNLIVDLEEIFQEQNYLSSNGINHELGTMFRQKYKEELPSLEKDFDTIYNDIIEYCQKYPTKTIIIDSNQLYLIKDTNIIKGKIIIMRSSVDSCYANSIKKFRKNNPNIEKAEINNYCKKQAKIYVNYKKINEFISKIEKNSQK